MLYSFFFLFSETIQTYFHNTFIWIIELNTTWFGSSAQTLHKFGTFLEILQISSPCQKKTLRSIQFHQIFVRCRFVAFICVLKLANFHFLFQFPSFSINKMFSFVALDANFQKSKIEKNTLVYYSRVWKVQPQQWLLFLYFINSHK